MRQRRHVGQHLGELVRISRHHGVGRLLEGLGENRIVVARSGFVGDIAGEDFGHAFAHVLVLKPERLIQRSLGGVVRRVPVRAPPSRSIEAQQAFHGGNIAEGGGHMQRASPIVIHGIGVEAGFEHQAHGCDIAGAGRTPDPDMIRRPE